MKQFRKIAAIILALLMLCLCGCGNQEGEAGNTNPPQTTTAPAQTTLPSESTVEQQNASGYTVKVVDESGAPIAGAMVQLCKDNCYPNVTDANGEAFFELAEDSYKVSFLMLPAGYTYSTDAQEFYFENGASELTIVLKATE